MKKLFLFLLCALPYTARAQYTNQTRLVPQGAKQIAPGETVLGAKLQLDTSASTFNAVTKTNVDIPFRVTFNGGAPNEITDFVIRDGQRVVAKSSLMMPKVTGYYFFLRNLKYLDNGPDVDDLQNFLNEYSPATVLAPSGPGADGETTFTLGNRSRNALTIFQGMNGLPVTGELDDDTRAFINNLRLKKKYVMIYLRFIDAVPVPAGSIKEFELLITTDGSAYGTFKVALGDNTDYLQTLALADTGEGITENFNPLPAGDPIVFLQTIPRILIDLAYEGAVTLVGPGTNATLHTSSDLRSWKMHGSYALSNGFAKVPWTASERKLFFKVSSP